MTIEFLDPLFREVKATAGRNGMLFKDYVTEALQDKLAKRPTHTVKPWMKFAGIAANDPEMVAELRRIEQIVDENFGQIEFQLIPTMPSPDSVLKLRETFAVQKTADRQIDRLVYDIYGLTEEEIALV